MVLSSKAIEEAIKEGVIEIQPCPDFSKCDTTSIDLHLGSLISLPKKDMSVSIDVSTGQPIIPTLQTLYEQHDIQTTGYALKPNQFILAQTREKISLKILPDKKVFAARVEGKSSLARCGLMVHFTAPTIHAGFEGHITLELINLGAFTINLQYGIPICQLIIEQVNGPVVFSKSQFHGQTLPEGGS